MERVAAYCRVSTDKGEQLISLQSQRKYFRDFISQHQDWNLVDVYYDEGVSGTSIKHRAGFQKMMDDVHAGKIDLIITKEVSRFARNTVDTLSCTRKLKAMGVGVIFINDNIDTLNPDGEFRLTIMASIAQEESRKISDRVKWGQMRRMEAGIVFGRDLLGYDVRNGKLFVNEKGAEIVRLIFYKYVKEHKGTHVIARELRESGILPMRAKEWNNTVILRVLRNEKYVGDLCQKKTYTPNFLTHEKKYNRGAEEMVYIRDHHIEDAIIDRETWDEAQKFLAERTLTDEQKSRHSCRYWCSGKIVCGECGKHFVSRTKKLSSDIIYKAWRCAAMAKHGTKKQNIHGIDTGCINQSANEQVLLGSVNYVLRLLKINRMSLLAEMKLEIGGVMQQPMKADIRSLKERIHGLEHKKADLLDKMLEGIVSSRDYKRQNTFYDTEIGHLQKMLDIQQELETEKANQSQKLKEYMERVRKMLDFEEPDEHICGEVTERITVYHGHVLEVKLRYIPAVRLKYRTFGRGSRYTAEFERI